MLDEFNDESKMLRNIGYKTGSSSCHHGNIKLPVSPKASWELQFHNPIKSVPQTEVRQKIVSRTIKQTKKCFFTMYCENIFDIIKVI